MANKSGYLNAQDIATTAALEALRQFRKEEKQNVKKNRLHNTGLLMDHYLEFIDYYEKIKYKGSDIVDELEFDEQEMISQDDVIIYSIKRSKIRTKILICQIEAAVEMTENQMKAKNEAEKFEVVRLLYMDKELKDNKFNQRIQMIAERIKCGESTVRRWNNEMLNELSEKLFGVDGLRLDI